MFEHKCRILAHYQLASERLRRHKWFLASTGGAALLAMMAAYALAPSADVPPAPLKTVLEPLSPPHLSVLQTDAGGPFLHEERIQPADTLYSLMARLSISDSEALNFIRNDAKTQAISRQLRPGKVVTAKTGEHGKLISLLFPLNSNESMTVVERNGTGFVASEQSLALESHTAIKFGEIRSSLFAATDAADIPDAIAIQMAEIFSGDIDFNRDLRKGDRFSIVYETRNHQGHPVSSGRILAAEFVNDQKTYTAFWYQGKNGKGGYYSTNGASLRKVFLRSPLEFSRVTSGFSDARMHLVLHKIRAHKGIDLAAPIGTKVRAVSDGIVEFAGRRGGYGNFLLIRHRASYSTAYGHLNGFAPGIRKGAHVSQGDTIGYVGMTGLATGPHLHYEFRINSLQVNPLAVVLPAPPPLDPTQVPAFKASITPLQSHLALAKQVQLAELK